jgi:hypothetical protein
MPICVLAAANCVQARESVVNHGGVKCAAAGIVMIFTLLIVSGHDEQAKHSRWIIFGDVWVPWKRVNPKNVHHGVL